MDDLTITKTCAACPEQYEVFMGDMQVAYLRLRHGYFYASCPDVGGEVVYESNPMGYGIFEDDERTDELAAAMSAIKRWLTKRFSPDEAQ